MPFVFAKLLAFLPFGNFLKGTSGKIILVVGLVGLLAFGYWKFKDNIRAEISDAFKQQQVEDLLVETKKEVERLRRIEEIRSQSLIAAIQVNEEIILAIQKGKQEIAGQKATEATRVLKDAMRTILEIEGGTESSVAIEETTPTIEESPKEEVKIEPTGNTWIDRWKKKVNE